MNLSGTIRRSGLVYALLFTAWATVIGWLTLEHLRVRQSARAALISRAKDISNTLGLVIRSQRRWGGIVSKERLEPALNELVRPGELNSIALLNASGDVLASAGSADFRPNKLPRSGEHWSGKTVTIMNLVDLGSDIENPDQPSPAIVLNRPELGPGGTNRPPRPPPRWRPTNFSGTISGEPSRLEDGSDSNRPPRNPGEARARFARLGRPYWMSEEEYKSISQKQGVHGFILVMSREPLLAINKHDLQLRAIIATLATILAVGSALGWRNLAKSSDLQLRLVRAGELNARLREMNLAAAGLAHETRNPLNIIRGLAQMISKQPDAAPDEVRSRSREIINEADRVTVQLNEFINYTRPREVRRQAVALNAVVGEVTRALSYDLEEKSIRLDIDVNSFVVQADEQLFRQALFNLLLNAIQAVNGKGRIEIAATRRDSTDISLDIRDNGPGVPSDKRTEVFKPYFTTSENGTGLGLAVVQQIVLAHGWEIECLSNQPNGAILRINHLRLIQG